MSHSNPYTVYSTEDVVLYAWYADEAPEPEATIAITSMTMEKEAYEVPVLELEELDADACIVTSCSSEGMEESAEHI